MTDKRDSRQAWVSNFYFTHDRLMHQPTHTRDTENAREANKSQKAEEIRQEMK